MMNKCIMAKIGGSKKHKFRKKKPKLSANRGKFINSAEIRGNL